MARIPFARACAFFCATSFLGGCSANNPIPAAPRTQFPAGITSVPLSTMDEARGGSCDVSVDGLVWYAVPEGSVSPVDFTRVRCTEPATLDGSAPPLIPSWARAGTATRAIFVPTSLQEVYSLTGMQDIESVARDASVPVTWMVGNTSYLLQNAPYYNTLHAADQDDVELENRPVFYTIASHRLPWYTPAVSVEGAGHERNIARAIALGNNAFWGITWNSHGTDNTSDEGAPWGAYCADPTSYKRPSPTGNCRLLAFEWTARDLTRAYFANTNALGYSAEAAFSTDPDDILQRGGFGPSDGAAYASALVDAYAAAGAQAPLVMMSQQESIDEADSTASDGVILHALYGEAKRVGMDVMTLRDADVAARAFAGQPRAIAFPYIAGGTASIRNGVPFFPATIDYHDNAAGMTFASGHTLPDRIFEYAQDPVSVFNRPLVATYPGNASYPSLRDVSATGGRLSFTFSAAVATHFGVAIWTDPSVLGVSGANVTPAGRAGFVVTFDLGAGTTVRSIACEACRSTTFPLSN
jgi:hypothetical protein